MNRTRFLWCLLLLQVVVSGIIYVHTAPCMQEKLAARVKGLLEQLHGFVDPFDLDVFTPYIQFNLHRQLHRSNVRNVIFFFC